MIHKNEEMSGGIYFQPSCMNNANERITKYYISQVLSHWTQRWSRGHGFRFWWSFGWGPVRDYVTCLKFTAKPCFHWIILILWQVHTVYTWHHFHFCRFRISFMIKFTIFYLENEACGAKQKDSDVNIGLFSNAYSQWDKFLSNYFNHVFISLPPFALPDPLTTCGNWLSSGFQMIIPRFYSKFMKHSIYPPLSFVW